MVTQNTARTTFWTILLSLATRLLIAADSSAIDSPELHASAADFDWSEYLQPPPADADSAESESFATLADAMGNASFSEAEITAKHLVEKTIAEGRQSEIRARALHNLAVAQHALGRHDAAKQNYIASVDVITASQNNLSPDLILPLRGLAAVFLATEQANDAFAALERAQHVSNVNYGPHSLRQLPILNARLDYYLRQGDADAAIDVLDHVNLLYTRKYDRLSVEMLPALYRKADVFGRLKHYGEERRAWRQILAIKQEHLPANDLELIEPNIRIAGNVIRTMRKDSMRSVSSSAAEKHLKAALRIAEDNPETGWQVQMECILSLADFYTLFDMKARARRYYSEAWTLLSSGEHQLAARAKSLEVAVPIARRPPDPYANFEYRPDRDTAEQEDYIEGEMTLTFTVDERGRTRDLRVVEADPPGFLHMERRVRNAVEQFIYRPRLDDGMPVATSDELYRARYFYVPSEYQASLEKTAARSRTRSNKQGE